MKALAATGVVASGVGVGVSAGCAGLNGVSGGPLTAANVPNGLSFATDGSPVVIGRDASGLYAMSSICTHAGCDMTQQGGVSGSEVDCYCHGSAFDANGNPIGGPAFSPLQHFEVTVAADGTITVDQTKVVAASTRTAITASAGTSDAGPG